MNDFEYWKWKAQADKYAAESGTNANSTGYQKRGHIQTFRQVKKTGGAGQ